LLLSIYKVVRLCQPSQSESTLILIINPSTHYLLFQENIMGTTLYNKIPLGRTSVLGSKRMQALLLAGAFVSMGLVWMAVRTLQ
jgi:hypothetical protein